MEECSNTDGVVENDEQFMREIRDQCMKLKRNNQEILKDMLNLKTKISRMMHTTIEKDKSQETEYNILQERIRRKKLQITNKIQELKARKLCKKTLNRADL